MILSDKDIKILVCCHKPCPLPQSEYLFPIQVGAALTQNDLGLQRDDQVFGKPCDNISHKNRNFCELTALYWAWKNIKSIFPDLKYIGLNHYRRYFSFHESDWRKNYIARPEEELSSYAIDKEKLSSWLSEGNIILPKEARLKTSVAQAYEHAHFSSDLRALRGVIQDKSPDFLEAFNEVMLLRHSFFDCNMFIMPFDEFSKYCDWLFGILFELEKRIDISHYDAYQQRIFGFLSERLLTLWVIKNGYPRKTLNYFLFSESPKRWNTGFLPDIKLLKSRLKEDLCFYLTKPRNQAARERFWKIP